MARGWLLVVAVASTVVVAGSCSGTPAVSHDAAVSRFCADTAGVGAMLRVAATDPAGSARLASFDRIMAGDVAALRAAGDVAVAAEGELVQSLISSRLAAGALGAGPDPQLQKAATMVADLRGRTC